MYGSTNPQGTFAGPGLADLKNWPSYIIKITYNNLNTWSNKEKYFLQEDNKIQATQLSMSNIQQKLCPKQNNITHFLKKSQQVGKLRNDKGDYTSRKGLSKKNF